MRPLNTCCFCCKLETGAYVLATFGLIVSFLYFVLLSFISGEDLEKHGLLVSPLYLIPAIADTISCVLLVIGTKRKLHHFILSYLIISPLSLLVQIIIFVWIINNQPYDENERFSDICGETLGVAFSIYCWYCIYSLYLRVKNIKNISGAYRV